MSISGSVNTMRKFPTPLIAILGPALGGIFLIPHPWLGALLWVGIFQNLRYAAFALLGVVIAEGIARIYQIRDTSPIDGSLKANALLAAVAAAWLTGGAGTAVQVQIAIVMVSAVSATILAAAIIRALAGSNLPPLALGYCVVAALLFAIFPHWTYTAVISMVWWPVPSDLLGWVVTFFRTLGALLFSPTLEVGIIVSVAVLLWSRVAFIAGVVGWIAGILTALGLSQQGVIYYWMPTAYNFFLAGMALGAVFFLPGRSSLLMAALGGCAASLFAVGFQHLLPTTAFGYLPLASILTTWIRIYALALATDQTSAQRNQTSHLPPEEAWWRATYWRRRSGPQGPFLVVPLSEPTQVAQGADGVLSHVGPWRYALDFQRPNLPGQPRRRAADGAAEWAPPVIAPAAGMVERVRDGVADNPLGICNYADNWGNHVLVRLDQGGWALLAHLRQGSVAVKPGARVEIGTYLGTVGNSGRSPVPHLHLQVQNSAALGAPTVPFTLANFLSASDPEKPFLQWHSATLPDQGTVVRAAAANPGTHAIVASMAPGTAVWDTQTDGVIPRPFRQTHAATTTRIAIQFDAAGRHLFKGRGSGTMVSSLDPDAWRVVDLQANVPEFLKLLALAVPSIPYAATAGMTWEEPAPIVALGLVRWLGLSLSPYLADPFPLVRCECISAPDGKDKPLIIETRLETSWRWLPSKLTCQFDRLRGPIRLTASFADGTVTYSLLSFEPGMPFDNDAV